MTTLSYTEARKNLKSVFDLATNQLEEIFIKRRNGKNVVIISEEEWNGWKETNYLLSSPKNAAHLKQAMHEIKTGQTIKVKLEDL